MTGGLGGIGLEVAGWLAEQGAGAIVLNGRRAPDAAAAARVEELRGRGVEVRAEVADVTDGKAVGSLLSRLDAELPPLGGVIHSVGVLSDGALTNQDWERFERVLWPKVLGAWHLHRATEDRDLDLFVLFSSASGVLGNAGQANYAAANAFLDQLALRRRALGLPGQAIAWGAWSGVGAAEEARERIGGRLAEFGESWIAPDRGIEALSRLVEADVGRSVVLAMDWSRLPAHPPLLEAIIEGEEGTAVAASAVTPLPDLGGALPLGAGEAPDRVPAERGALRAAAFVPAGSEGRVRGPRAWDSLMAVGLRDRLNRALPGAPISNTAMFDYPDVNRLAGTPRFGAVSGGFAAPGGLAPGWSRRRPSPRPRGERRMTGSRWWEWPVGFREVRAWRLSGRCSWKAGDAVTGGRPRDHFGNGDNPEPGAYLPGLDTLDADFFGVSPLRSGSYMDPQQRMLLEVSWTALEHAGIAPRTLRGSRSGVYAGVALNEYALLISRSPQHPVQMYRYLGTSPSATVNRVSYFLGFEGPALAVETACSSSLVATHQAIAGSAAARGGSGACRRGERHPERGELRDLP